MVTTVLVLLIASFAQINKEDRKEIVLLIITSQVTLMGSALGFYFGKESGTNLKLKIKKTFLSHLPLGVLGGGTPGPAYPLGVYWRQILSGGPANSDVICDKKILNHDKKIRQACRHLRQISTFTHDTLMAGTPAISVSGGRKLNPLKNKDFLICIFLSLNEGVWGRPFPRSTNCGD
ncbi:hypothetical protein HC931_26960 [Candidatus Gracilibacteria bacterium]|nr:hypothetical protein [Candidatus Gracilibacteria bacterium]